MLPRPYFQNVSQRFSHSRFFLSSFRFLFANSFACSSASSLISLLNTKTVLGRSLCNFHSRTLSKYS